MGDDHEEPTDSPESADAPDPVDLSETSDSEAPEEWNFDAVDDDDDRGEEREGGFEVAATDRFDDPEPTAADPSDAADPTDVDDSDDVDDSGDLDETMAELDDDVETFETRSDDDAEDDPFAALEADEPHSTPGSAPSSSGSTPEGEDDDPFDQMDVDVATDDVWESLDSEGSGFEIGGEATLVDRDERHEDHLVSKRQYCQRCPHFSEPPGVECGHEGTTIVEVVGIDEFRVRNCPMVTEDDPKFDRGDG